MTARKGLGASNTLQSGSKRWKRWVNPASSYLSSNDPRAHFGLGPATAVERIEVTWPDGAREVFPGCPADRRIELRKGEGKAVER